MCLSTVSQTFNRPPNSKIITAYKVFTKPQTSFGQIYDYAKGRYITPKSTDLQLPLQSRGSMVTRDKWVTASRVSRTNKPGRNKSYVHGFHAFATRRSAIGAARGSFGNHSTVRKVFLAGVHTKGKQYGDKHCYVANKMYVPLLTTKPPKVPSAKTSAVRRASSKR